jgi:molecular chaperone Hsp33
MAPQHDRLIQGMTANGEFRIIAAQTTQSIETARARLDLSPIATDSLGRAMTAAVLLARLLEKHVREQRVTLRFEGDGPLGTLIAEASISGDVRGYVRNPLVSPEELNGGSAVGSKGSLTVVRGTPPAGKPYVSQVELVSGEVAGDVARYLARSEQIASAVVLGVLNRREGVAAAGGIIIQAFPHTPEEAIARMEERVRDAGPLSALLDRMPIEEAVEHVLHDVGYKAIDSSFNVPVRFHCTCTRERALAPMQLFSPQELAEMIQQEDGSEVICQYCGKKYQFSGDDLLAFTDIPEA